MERRAKIKIEQFDNGFSLHWEDLSGEADDSKRVVYKKDVKAVIGEEIMSDIKSIMDASLSDIVEMEIKYTTKES